MKAIEKMFKEIEREKDVTILYACETGSRAWGFPSPDSDYDIRFIYAHKKDWYLSLTPKKDTIEFMIDDLDITGWDLRKSLLLLGKSNAALIERFNSPIVYYEKEGFRKEYRSLIEGCYSPTSVFYHHLSQAAKFMEEIENSDKVKLKSFFYLLRSLLSCNWIIHDSSVVPMQLEGLMKYINEPDQWEIRELVKLKSEKDEKYVHDKESLPLKWLKDMFQELNERKGRMGVSKPDHEKLYQFFLKTV